MKRFQLLIVVLIFLFSLQNSQIGYAQTTNYKAYSLFTYNFIKNSHWPNNYDNFIITVVGRSKIYNELVTLVETRTIDGKKIEVVQADDFDPTKLTHILLVSDGSSNNLKSLVENTKGKAVLVITEREGLVSKGACISFVILETGALRFQVNEEELTNRNIQISKGLMSMAQK